MSDTEYDEMRELAERAWPLGGYAPGAYHCRCHSCERTFEGDKRAITCLECAVIAIKARCSPKTDEETQQTALRYARADMAKAALLNGCRPVAAEWQAGVYDKLPDITARVSAFLAGVVHARASETP